MIHNTAISSILSAEAAAHSKIKLYIYLGSSESYSGGFDFGLVPIPTPEETPFVIPNLENPRWGYGASKSLGELSTYANHLQLGLNFIILRIHNIYGPRMGNMHVIPDLIQKFLKNENKLHGLNETRSFMYIDDFVNIVSKILESPSKFINTVYNIGSGKEIMISQLALMIKNLLNKDLVFQDVGRLPGSVARRCPDISLIRSKIEYSETSLSSGLEKTINWYLANFRY